MAKITMEEREVVDCLEALRGSDLSVLCEIFVLPTSGSNLDKVSRLLELGSASYERLVQLARLVRFGYCSEDYVSSRNIDEILSSLGLRVRGSKHDMFMEAVLNDRSPASAMMASMDIRGVRSIYKCIFDESPIDNASTLIRKIESWLDYRSPNRRPLPPITRAGLGRDDSSGRNLETLVTSPGVEQPMKGVVLQHYDVAISYAGEDVAIARELAEEMGRLGSGTFFAPYHKASLWGRSLNEELKVTFGERATYVLVLVSKHYAVKDFTNFEFTIARDEARRRKEVFILPVRLDDTPLIGLHPDVYYMDYRKDGAKQIARLMKEKLDARKK
jgi:hypothetical protein